MWRSAIRLCSILQLAEALSLCPTLAAFPAIFERIERNRCTFFAGRNPARRDYGGVTAWWPKRANRRERRR